VGDELQKVIAEYILIWYIKISIKW